MATGLKTAFALLGLVQLALVGCVDSRLRDAVPPSAEQKDPLADGSWPEEGGGESRDGGRSEGGFVPPPVTGSPVPFFQKTEIIDVELRGEFHKALEGDGRLIIQDAGFQSSYPVRFSALADPKRESRCKTRPLAIQVPRVGGHFQNLVSGQLTLIPPCRIKSRSRETSKEAQAIFAEHLLHRILFTTARPHYRTRIARLTYRDAKDKIVSETFGYFIEPTRDLASRYRMTVATAEEASELLRNLDPRHRIGFRLAAHLARVSEGAETRILRGAAPSLALTLPGVFDSDLVNPPHCGSRSCWGDADFLRDLLSNSEIDSVSAWREAVLAETRRLRLARGFVEEVARRYPYLRSRRIEQRVSSFFDAIDEFVVRYGR